MCLKTLVWTAKYICILGAQNIFNIDFVTDIWKKDFSTVTYPATFVIPSNLSLCNTYFEKLNSISNCIKIWISWDIVFSHSKIQRYKHHLHGRCWRNHKIPLYHFGFIGPPKRVQSDRGTEFQGAVKVFLKDVEYSISI